MRVLYHFPYPNTLSAGRTIANGYKNAFTDLGHSFRFLTSNDIDQEKVFSEFSPDIFITALSPLPLKYLDLNVIRKFKKRGLNVFVNIPFWKSPLSALRVNEAPSIKNNKEYVNLLTSKHYGDVYFNTCEQDDERMEGFKKTLGINYQTLLLAADKSIIYPDFNNKFISDISYIGTNLPQKRPFFKQIIYPIEKKYDVSIYGQDWTFWNKQIGIIQKIGQYFNLPLLKDIRKPALQLSDERKIYTSSTISVNIHEKFQIKYGDLNERTFKIPLASGFEIIDNVRTIKKYFTDEKDIIIAKNAKEWNEKIEFYIRNPEKRLPIISAGRKLVAKKHTYHNRVKTMISWYKK